VVHGGSAQNFSVRSRSIPEALDQSVTKMSSRFDAGIKPSEITPESVFMSRRTVLAAAVACGLVPSAMASAATIPADGTFPDLQKWPDSTTEKPASFKDITTYNNFYEFGTDKGDPAVNAHTLKTSPWSVQVTGECGKPGILTLEDVLKPHALEERIYRHRCVEAWSMVIPWVGFPLADLLKRFEPNSNAKYVQFFSLADKQQMPGVRYPVLQWPYREGLTIAEAMHPLTLATVGLYGKVLPNQSGAPIRIVIRGSTGSRAQNRSFESNSRAASRRRAGTWRLRASTAFIRT